MSRKLELFVAVTGENFHLPRVRAAMRLPAQGGGRLDIRLYPRPEVPTAFTIPFAWELAGDLNDIGGTVVEHVTAPRVVTERVSFRRWDVTATDVTVHAVADEVRTTAFLGAHGKELAGRTIVFRLSPGPALNPVQVLIYRLTGDVRVRTSHRKIIGLGCDRLRFGMEYKREADTGRRRRQLVGEIHTARTADELLPLLEDVLSIASVAMRYRVVCLGWSQRHARELVTCYRGNIDVPRKRKWDANEALIPPEHIQEFVSRAYRKLRRSTQDALLRQVLWRLAPHHRESVDRRILRLYGVLESLVLVATRDKDRELILPKSQFKALRRVLLNVLAKEVPSRTARGLIEAKLPELNRPAFAQAFQRTCLSAKVALHEFWPIIASDEFVSISQLRNRLIHGDYIPNDPGLETAADHLQWVVERLLLAHLGWDCNKSHVSTGALRDFVAYSSWKTERAALTEALHGLP